MIACLTCKYQQFHNTDCERAHINMNGTVNASVYANTMISVETLKLKRMVMQVLPCCMYNTHRTKEPTHVMLVTKCHTTCSYISRKFHFNISMKCLVLSTRWPIFIIISCNIRVVSLHKLSRYVYVVYRLDFMGFQFVLNI